MIDIETELKKDVYNRDLKVDDMVAFNSQGRMAVGTIKGFSITKQIIKILIVTPQEIVGNEPDGTYLNRQEGKVFNIKSKVVLLESPDFK